MHSSKIQESGPPAASHQLLAVVGRLSLCSALVLSPLLEARVVRADVPEETASDEIAEADELSAARRSLAVGAAVVPGAIVHGSGHWVAGRKEAAETLALVQVSGLGLFLLGGGIIVVSGASRYLVGPSAVLVIAGAGALTTSWVADLYGVAVPNNMRGSALAVDPIVQSEIGYAYVYDPQFAYRHFLTQRTSWRLGRVAIEPSAWFAMGDANTLLRFEASYRLAGRTLREEDSVGDGSFADLAAAAMYHDYAPQGFGIVTGETQLVARYDIRRLASDLKGMFAEGGVGLALQAIDYDAPGYALGDELETLLLARFGIGAYVDTSGSEVALFYDHRHDGFAAGLKLRGLGSGVAGHFGLRSRLFFSPSFGLAASVLAGSAYVTQLALVYRAGARP